MKWSVTALVYFIICILGSIFALRYIEPIEFSIRENYGMTLEELKPKCDNKDEGLYTKIITDQNKSSSVRGELVQQLVRKAKAKAKDCEVTGDDWDKWTKELCIPNKTLKDISKSAIDKVQQCVDKENRLKDGEIVKAQRDLFENFCNKVKVSAWFSYQSVKLENP